MKSSIEHKKGKSFACSRDVSPQRSYIPYQLKNVPGPGEVNFHLFSMMMDLDRGEQVKINQKQLMLTYPTVLALIFQVNIVIQNMELFSLKEKDSLI